MSKNVAIFFGGQSAEHEVSLQSAVFVAATIKNAGFIPVLIGISKEGQWFYYNSLNEALINKDSASKISLNLHNGLPALVVKSDKQGALIISKKNSEKWEVLSKIDIAFPLVHGPFGEDGSLQGFFEVLNIPYVGCDHYSSSLCMDKGWCKSVLHHFGFKTARWITFNYFEYSPEKCLKALKDKGLTYPLFVKPCRLGSSVGISKVGDEKELFYSIKNAFDYDSSVILEEAVKNCREIEVSVLDDPLKGRKKTVCSVPGEVVPSTKHGFYSYEAKYLDTEGAVLKIPAKLSKHLLEQVQNQALRAFKALRCRGMARVDLFLKENSEVLINEINTIPGFTKISMYPKLWQASGLSSETLIEKLVLSALLDNKE